MTETNWLNSFEMKNIEKTASETDDETLIDLLEIVKRVTKKKRKDSVWWFCYPDLELVEIEKGRMTKSTVRIALGPIWTEIVPLWQNKIEERCGARIQSCDFDIGKGSEIFFVARIESATDIFSKDSVIRRKLNEPDGEKAIIEEIEEIVGKLGNAFKKFNGIVDTVMAM